MKLYTRDFSKLTDEELSSKTKFEEIRRKIHSRDDFNIIPKEHFKSIMHYNSYFPNNYLCHTDLSPKNDDFFAITEIFLNLIDDKSIIERKILKFIKEYEAYFIIASIVKDYSFGHHSLFVFPEFQLSNDYKPDYVIVGKNSDGHHFIFVELESPYGNIIIGDGNFGEAIRTGINQTRDWNVWLQKNFSQIRQEFEKYSKENDILPNEFHNFDATRIHYVVIAGRRTDFDEKSRRLRREEFDTRKTKIMHYDNLIETAQRVIKEKSY
jgi:hypothetical protein